MVDYQFYVNAFHGGSISQEEFPAYARAAADKLAYYKRVYTVTVPSVPEDAPDPESMAICAMADALYGFDLVANGEGGPVQSASIGSVSASYGNSGSSLDISPKGQSKELYRLACLYLEIYRGVG